MTIEDIALQMTPGIGIKGAVHLLELFGEINKGGQTILMVTHSVKAASRAGRVLFLKDGQVFYQLRRENDTDTQFYQRISHALTALTTGGDAQ